jgi:hypothetical protein
LGGAINSTPATDTEWITASPEVQEAMHAGKIRRLVQGLPQETLQQGRMGGHVIEHLGRGQPLALQLPAEPWIDDMGTHSQPPI